MAVQYRKVNPSEIIDVGDILMISPENQRVTKAIRDRYGINERLVIGVVTKSDNTTPMPILVDGGSSKKVDRAIVGNGNSEICILSIDGGNSELNAREYVDVVSSGTTKVGIDDEIVRIGDRLTISRFTAGKAEKRKISNTDPSGGRSIGKAITNLEEGCVQALLNIE